MSLEYPDFIDPQKAAEGHRTFSGTMPLARMERLKSYLTDDSGVVQFTAQFDTDSLVGVCIRVEVDAALWLLCQRSLEPYQEKVQRSSLLGVIDDISKEGLLPDGYEAVLVEHGKIAFLDMVEDELLLGLPQVPRNPDLPEAAEEFADSEKVTGGKISSSNVQQPFAGLAEQLKEFASGRKEARNGDGKDSGRTGKKLN